MIDPSNKGKTFPPFSLTVERGKLREFLAAIGDDNSEYLVDDPLMPPTFTTVLTFWGGVNLEQILRSVGVDIWNVLHGEQSFEYYRPIHVGDMITGQSRIDKLYSKAGMDFIEIVTEFKNELDLPVLNDYALIIVKGPTA